MRSAQCNGRSWNNRGLLGGGAEIAQGSCLGRPCALPPGTNTVHMVNSFNATYLMQTVVHELAHVIDWQHFARTSRFLSSGLPGADAASRRDVTRSYLTEYGQSNRFEYFAEAVATWVYGSKFKGTEQDRGYLSPLQVSYLVTWLGGW